MNLIAGILAFLIAVSYFCALFFAQLFFTGKVSLEKVNYVRGIVISCSIFVLCLLITFGTLFLPEEIGNRVLHAFAGGFLTFIACTLGIADSAVRATRFQMIVLSLLLVTLLGVGNELFEFLLQSTTSLVFAPTGTDTWLDLVSNTVGMVLATPFAFLLSLNR